MKDEILIKQGHVRLASRAADSVYLTAGGSEGTDNGVVLMTALLLVQRLSTTHECDPRDVLGQIARCFDVKEGAILLRA